MITLITGGAGFLGSHLAEKLITAGDEVWVLDDLSTGSIFNIDHLRQNQRFHFQMGTVANPYLVGEMVDRADRVFHLAAAVGVQLVVKRPIYTLESNIVGTGNVLSAASVKGKPVLVTSTSEVYGKSTKYPHAEDDDIVIGPSSCARWGYACSKAADEFLALAYYKEKALPAIVVRLFNVAGPRQTGRYGMVLPRFVQQALKNESLTVYGDGKQSRSFGHVDDITGALIKLMNSEKSVGRVFNVGSDVEISIFDLAKKVIELTGSSSCIKMVPYSEAFPTDFEDTMRRVPDLSRLKAEIGYVPKHNYVTLIEDVINYYRRKNG